MILNEWYAVASSDEVSQKKPVTLHRFGQDFVLYRNRQGMLQAFYDRCPHRGAALSGGHVAEDHLVCPFHGLIFNEQGACTYVPAEGAEQPSRHRFQLKTCPVKEAHGIIYLWYGTEKPYKAPPFFPILANDAFTYAERTDLWPVHYSRVIENQLDVIHLPFVHRKTIGRGGKTLVNGPYMKWLSDDVLVISAQNAINHGQRPLKPADYHWPKKVYLAFQFPNFWMNHISDDVLVMIFFVPIDERNTKLYMRFYHKVTHLPVVKNIIAYIGGWMNVVIEREDKQVVRTQRPIRSDLFMGETLLMGDAPIIAYRKRRHALQQQAKNLAEKP